MKKIKISIGTIAAFVAIGVLRGCQDYHLEQQREKQHSQIIIHKLEEINFEDYFVPAENNHAEEIQFTYKK